MPVIVYVPRAFGGTLILIQIVSPPVVIAATGRDGIVQAYGRDGIVTGRGQP